MARRLFGPFEFITVADKASLPNSGTKGMLYRIADKGMFYLCEQDSATYNPIGGAVYPDGGKAKDILRLVDPDTGEVNWEEFPLSDDELEYVHDRIAAKPGAPVNYDPEDGEIDVYQAPDFVGSPYNNFANQAPMEAVRLVIATDQDMQNVVFDEVFYQDSTIVTPTNFYSLIQPGVTYYWRLRYADTYGVWSYWSDATSLTTMAEFKPTIIKEPTILHPSEGARVAPVTPFIAADSFKIIGTADTHASTDWQVSGLPDFSVMLYESLDDAAHLTHIQLPITLTGDAYARCRYKGQNTAEKSPWSSRRYFRLREVYNGMIIGVGWRRIAENSIIVHHIDENGNDVTVDTAYFDNHPLFQFTVAEILGQQVILVNPVYCKCYYNENAEIGEDIARWWISPEARDGFELHPAFKASDGNPIYWGQYCAGQSSDSVIVTSVDSALPYAIVKGYNVRGSYMTQILAAVESVYNSGIDGDHKGWHLETIYDVALRYLLMMIELSSYTLLGNSTADNIANNGSGNNALYNTPVNAAANLTNVRNWRNIFGAYYRNVLGFVLGGVRGALGDIAETAASTYMLLSPANLVDSMDTGLVAPGSPSDSGTQYPMIRTYHHGYNAALDCDAQLMFLGREFSTGAAGNPLGDISRYRIGRQGSFANLSRARGNEMLFLNYSYSGVALNPGLGFLLTADGGNLGMVYRVCKWVK
jgi:hypothetical protein